MPPTTGPTTNDPHNLGGLSTPNTLQRDGFPAFAALAKEHPALLTQLRGMFFRTSFQDVGATLSDGEVLRLAAALYADDALRGRLVSTNREQGQLLLDLGVLLDDLYDRGGSPFRLPPWTII
jgi:hypothetical protein